MVVYFGEYMFLELSLVSVFGFLILRKWLDRVFMYERDVVGESEVNGGLFSKCVYL